jgi:hypothetical protein
MSAHDWTTWAPARVGNTSRWRLIRFETVDAQGRPVGRCTESKTPAGDTRTFPTEAVAQGCADLLNAEARGDA